MHSWIVRIRNRGFIAPIRRFISSIRLVTTLLRHYRFTFYHVTGELFITGFAISVKMPCKGDMLNQAVLAHTMILVSLFSSRSNYDYTLFARHLLPQLRAVLHSFTYKCITVSLFALTGLFALLRMYVTAQLYTTCSELCHANFLG